MNTQAARRLRTGHIIIIDVVLLTVMVAGLCWLALRVWDTARSLQDAAGYARTMPDAVASGDLAGAGVALTGFAEASAAAADATQVPGWSVAEALPFVGADVTAVRVLATQADALGQATSGVAGLLSDDAGGLDAAALGRIGVVAASASTALSDADGVLASLDRDALLAPIANAVDDFQGAVAQASPAVSTAHAFASLGSVTASGPADILVLLQNNAEARTGGGITGAFMLIHADGDALELVAQADSSQFADRTSPIATVPASMDALYGDVSARFVQNASMPVDFAETARLATAWWESIGYSAPDAVVSIDPLVLRAVLALTGPIALPDGSELNVDNIVTRLLVDPYMTLDSDAQTAALQSAAQSIFDRVSTIELDPIAWVSTLAEPISEGRISLWTSDADAESVIATSTLGGPAARIAASGDDTYAVLFNDATGGKMDTYLQVEIATGTRVCRADGRTEVVVRLTMSSTAPQDAGNVLPGSMTGNGLFGTGSGDIGTSVSISAPPGTFPGGVTKDGEPELSVDVEDAGRPTSLVRINLSPDEVNVVEFHFIAADADTPRILHTPVVNDIPVRVMDAGELGACA